MILVCLGSLGALWGRPGPLLGYLGRLNRLGALVAASGGSPAALLGPSWVLLGRLQAVLGPLGPRWDRSWTVLGPSWAALGPSSGRLGSFLGRLGALLGRLRALLDAFWAVWSVL